MSLLQARKNGVELLQKLIKTKEKELERLKTELVVRTSLLNNEIEMSGLGKTRKNVDK